MFKNDMYEIAERLYDVTDQAETLYDIADDLIVPMICRAKQKHAHGCRPGARHTGLQRCS